MSTSAATPEPTCSIARALQTLGEKWSLLIVRSAFQGDTRFSEFRDRLGVPTDVLAARLATLVDAQILERRSYREPGARERSSYHLTPSGRELKTVLAALSQWGAEHRPTDRGASPVYVDGDARPVRVQFVAASGHPLDGDEVAMVPGPGAVIRW